MNKLGMVLLYTSSILMIIWGIGDQFIHQYLDVHLRFLGNPEPSELLSKSQDLSMLFLHSVGGGLISAGVSMLVLTHFGIKKGQKWALWSFLTIAFIAQGFNGYGMYSAGSHFWYPLMILLFSLIGVVLIVLSNEPKS